MCFRWSWCAWHRMQIQWSCKVTSLECVASVDGHVQSASSQAMSCVGEWSGNWSKFWLHIRYFVLEVGWSIKWAVVTHNVYLIILVCKYMRIYTYNMHILTRYICVYIYIFEYTYILIYSHTYCNTRAYHHLASPDQLVDIDYWFIQWWKRMLIIDDR